MAEKQDPNASLIKVTKNSSKAVKDLNLPGAGEGDLTRKELYKAASFEKFVNSITVKELGELLVSYSKLKDNAALLRTIRTVVPDTQDKPTFIKSCLRLGQAFNVAMDTVKPRPKINDKDLGPTLEPIYKAIEEVSREETNKTPRNKRDFGRGPASIPSMDSQVSRGLSKRNGDLLESIHPSGG